MRNRNIILLLGAALLVSPLCAQSLDGLPSYHGNNDQFGEIRIWGNETMLPMLTAWELGIHDQQRGLRFADVLPSGAAAIGALYTGVADLGPARRVGHESPPRQGASPPNRRPCQAPRAVLDDRAKNPRPSRSHRPPSSRPRSTTSTDSL